MTAMSHRTFDDPHGTTLEARQGLLDNRSEKGPKRHRVLGRRKRLSAKKKAKVKHANAVRLVAFRRWKARVRAYWSGAAEEHP
jgi:hypothetical protein